MTCCAHPLQTLSRHTVRSAICVAVRQLVCASAPVLAGCGGVQSALDPGGREAFRIANLFWWMAGGAVIVWLAVIGLAVYSVRVPPESHTPRASRLMIVWAGALVPALVLSVLLVYGLSPLAALVAPAPEGSLTILVSGEQWWWRVRYLGPNGDTISLANEIRLPVGEPVEFRLDSPDVIHSFWIPSLAGKMDMIPGRTTRLVLNPTRIGLFRGVCGEYCGTSHARMAFSVLVQDKDEFDRWLADQAQPAQPAAGQAAERGQELFLASGCGACHAVRGTSADGVVGPDLTHVGSRLSLAAGTLTNELDTFRRFVTRPEDVKPGVLMPAFHMLPPDDLPALAAYLEGLK
jgi:cytochrome c oxidase subunit II